MKFGIKQEKKAVLAATVDNSDREEGTSEEDTVIDVKTNRELEQFIAKMKNFKVSGEGDIIIRNDKILWSTNYIKNIRYSKNNFGGIKTSGRMEYCHNAH